LYRAVRRAKGSKLEDIIVKNPETKSKLNFENKKAQQLRWAFSFETTFIEK
jgi:hypothetical protein